MSLEELSNFSVQDLLELIHPEDKTAIREKRQSLLEGKEVPNSSRFRVVRKDGTIRHLESYAEMIVYKGQPAIHQIYFDITSYWEAMKGSEL